MLSPIIVSIFDPRVSCDGCDGKATVAANPSVAVKKKKSRGTLPRMLGCVIIQPRPSTSPDAADSRNPDRVTPIGKISVGYNREFFLV